MDSTSREHTSTEHALRVLVRIDTRQRLACLEVRGCLTPDTCTTLMNILAHTGTLGAAVSVNLLRAAHVDARALRRLLDGADTAVRADPERASSAPVEILVPAVLPRCRIQLETGAAAPERAPLPAPDQSAASGRAPRRALTNKDAAELAFLRRDPRVLAVPAAEISLKEAP